MATNFTVLKRNAAQLIEFRHDDVGVAIDHVRQARATEVRAGRARNARYYWQILSVPLAIRDYRTDRGKPAR